MPKVNNYAFIDGTNLHLTFENMGWKLDYDKLANYLTKKLNVTIIYWFMGDIEGNKDIHRALQSYGYTLKLKEASPFTVQAIECPYCNKIIENEKIRYKCDCDSYLTMQIFNDWSNYDKAVIITSDGDFDKLIKRLLCDDKLRLVFAPSKKGCSRLLARAARGRIEFIDNFKNSLEKK
jgi:uncharacterized LabA/DUF88 family protein